MALAHTPGKPPKPTGPLVKGLPVYTKNQFLQVRPKGSYQGYLNYINRKRGAQPASAGTRAAAPASKVPTYASLLAGMSSQIETPAQLEARAKRMTDTDIASQTTIIREDAEAAAKKAHERALALSAAGRAAAGMNAGLFNAVGGEYNAGAQELNRLGSLSGGMAAQTQADVSAENASLANVGAPGVEAAGVMAGPGQAGVEQFRGATLGAENFGTQGEAATFGLAGLVSAQNLRATQEANLAYNQREAEIQEARSKAVKEISRGRPELAQKYLLQLQDAQRQQIALAMSLIEARNSRGDQILQNTVTRHEDTRAAETHTQDITAGNVDIKTARLAWKEIDVVKSQALGYVVKKDGTPLLQNGKKVPFSAIADQVKAGGAGGMTANQKQKWTTELFDTVASSYYGTKRIKLGNGQWVNVAANDPRNPNFDPNDDKTWGKNPQGWFSALKKLRNKGAKLDESINILRQFYKRGEQGTPNLFAAERKQTQAYYGKAVVDNVLKTVRKLQNQGRWDHADSLIQALLNHSYKAP